MRAALLLDTPGRMEVVDVRVDAPLHREVLIRTIGSGLCHSDLHLIDGVIDVSGYAEGGAVLGHEAAGVVEAVGADVQYVQPGDHVATFPVQSCGHCGYCASGNPTLCEASPGARSADAPPRLTHAGKPLFQFSNLGAFAEQMLVHESAVVKIDPDYPLDRAAVIGCGVATGLGAVFNTAAVRPGSTVAVIGLGGVGLSVVQGAHVAGARQIVAVDTKPEKLELAKTLGATDGVDASVADVVEAVREVTAGGVDFSFEAIGHKQTIEQSVLVLRRGGVATVAGVGLGQTIELDAGLFLYERRLQGSLMGSVRLRSDLPCYIELDKAGRIDVGTLIESHIGLEQINDGYDAMRRGDINGRRVILFPA